MALSRRSVQRMSGSIWPGFVDAMTALLLVLMFVLTIFMVVQYVLREQITGQEDALEQLNAEINILAQALGLEQQAAANLEDDLARSQAEISRQSTLIANLTTQVDQQSTELDDRAARIASFEEQVAGLIADRDTAIARGDALEDERADLLTEQEALQLALATARDEVDAQSEVARLAAARRDALEALAADLRSRLVETSNTLTATENDLAAAQDALSDEEAARLAEAAAAELLRERLQNADVELTAMTLALEEQRREAEETLTLLAAANAVEAELEDRLTSALAAVEADEADDAELARKLTELELERDALRAQLSEAEGSIGTQQSLRDQLADALAARLAAEAESEAQMSEAERQSVLLATANAALSQEEAQSAKAQREVALLNEQVAALRAQLGSLQSLLNQAASEDEAARVQIEALGSQLNTALARVASEERRRRELEETERLRLEEEARRLAEEAVELERYRSDFFGAVREVIEGRKGVRIVGDRFVFSSEVLFESASASLSREGQLQIAGIVSILQDVADDIPESIDWILRVDGHTDNVPLRGGIYADNWELSQARALSVVRFMTDQLEFPPDRLAATGFGEFRPVNPESSPEARAQNRRIELKLTER